MGAVANGTGLAGIARRCQKLDHDIRSRGLLDPDHHILPLVPPHYQRTKPRPP